MTNQEMARKLAVGEALDVHSEGGPLGDRKGLEQITVVGGVFRLRQFVDGVEYCDAQAELWIRSVGRRFSDGAIIASTTKALSGNPHFHCLLVR